MQPRDGGVIDNNIDRTRLAAERHVVGQQFDRLAALLARREPLEHCHVPLARRGRRWGRYRRGRRGRPPARPPHTPQQRPPGQRRQQ